MRIVNREQREALEHTVLSSDASFSDESEGRNHSSDPDLLRTEFQRDRDKIIHCKSFRRLSHKTQVFIAPKGDHYRTRLTHTLEVAQIARTISRALDLNEDLTEAIALGHDLGHTPFGHTGEEALTAAWRRHADYADGFPELDDVFHHNVQSLRVVDVVENGGVGLNLTSEVRDGILCHTGAQSPDTLEGRIVGISDRIAYVNHDIDDAIRAGVLGESDLPASTHRLLGADHSSRIETLVVDCVRNSKECADIRMSQQIWDAMMELRQFLFENVYRRDIVMREVDKAYHLIGELFDYFMSHMDEVPQEYRSISQGNDVRAVTDFIASMTDRYARGVYEELFVPHSFTTLDS